MEQETKDLRESYANALQEYLIAQSEKSLYEASLLSKMFVEQGIGPEEIVAVHSESVDTASKDMPAMERARMFSASFQFLLEIMITYGVRYKEYLDLKLTEATRAIEIQMEVDRIRTEESIKSHEEVIKGKEEFLSFVAHELRNPLTVIMGSISYMLRGADTQDPNRQQTLLNRARESTEQLLQLINDLLSLSQMEVSEEPLNIQVVDADQLVHKAVGNILDAAKEKNMDVEIRPPHRTEKLFGDPEWLLRMLDNLLTNAIKFTADGGKVWVETKSTGRHLQIDVGDTGIGIAPEVIPHLFEKFYRVRGGWRPHVEGTGLGLSLVNRIVGRHGGKITVQSKIGEGSVFTVLLPLAE